MSLVAALLVVVATLLAWPGPAPGTSRAGTGRGITGRAGTSSRRWVPGLGRRGEESWVAEAAEVAAVALRAGVPLAAAALVAARSPGVVAAAPWLRTRLEAALARGDGVAGVLTAPSVDGPPRASEDLRLLARAWSLSEETGAAAAHTTAAAAASLRARSAARDLRDATLAGPRASMRVLTALPLVGPAVGLALGLSPAVLYATPAARLSAGVGALLTLSGWAWARRLVGAAGRPGRTDGSA
ncbi:hypothetical protein [Phycicoccus jejuensis]|uniref:hypothetical protein n=1 Tax=Phycicoccus jejuensis TaxID=367299 RepID=UPI0004C2DC1D|nr:hypothetical protein [Phycicoccus jejuensis]